MSAQGWLLEGNAVLPLTALCALKSQFSQAEEHELFSAWVL